MYRRCCHFSRMHQQDHQQNLNTPQEGNLKDLNHLKEEAPSLRLCPFRDKSRFFQFLLHDVQQKLQDSQKLATLAERVRRQQQACNRARFVTSRDRCSRSERQPLRLFVPSLSTWTDGVCVSGGRSCKRGFCRKDDACTARFNAVMMEINLIFMLSACGLKLPFNQTNFNKT